MNEIESNGEMSSRSDRRSQLRESESSDLGRRRRRWIVWTASIALVGMLGAVVVSLLASGFFGTASDDYTGSGSGDVLFTISDGQIGDQIANNLVTAGVIKSFDPFYALLLKQDPAAVFIPGVYALHEKMSSTVALSALLDPANRVVNKVVIPEGTVLTVALSTISESLNIPLADLQTAAADVGSFGLPAEATTLEGFIYPATYTFSPGVSASEILTTMVNESLATLDSLGVPIEDRWHTIVMASIVQRESGSPDNDYKVSRVFQNRIDSGMTLGSDVTTCYGAGLIGKECIYITQAQLDDASNLYNTRLLPGLPIGPISNPGKTAMDAARNPADGPWLFFVTVNLQTGETIFSETVQEHDAAAAQYEEWLAAHPEFK
ncbi:MAG: endolytic transglycosylase MltG [Actinomycetales bacterium]|nr:endolytic transglycosylase MltG [Actinomycetales bacterium]